MVPMFCDLYPSNRYNSKKIKANMKLRCKEYVCVSTFVHHVTVATTNTTQGKPNLADRPPISCNFATLPRIQYEIHDKRLPI